MCVYACKYECMYVGAALPPLTKSDRRECMYAYVLEMNVLMQAISMPRQSGSNIHSRMHVMRHVHAVHVRADICSQGIYRSS